MSHLTIQHLGFITLLDIIWLPALVSINTPRISQHIWVYIRVNQVNWNLQAATYITNAIGSLIATGLGFISLKVIFFSYLVDHHGKGRKTHRILLLKFKPWKHILSWFFCIKIIIRLYWAQEILSIIFSTTDLITMTPRRKYICIKSPLRHEYFIWKGVVDKY